MRGFFRLTMPHSPRLPVRKNLPRPAPSYSIFIYKLPRWRKNHCGRFQKPLRSFSETSAVERKTIGCNF